MNAGADEDLTAAVVAAWLVADGRDAAPAEVASLVRRARIAVRVVQSQTVADPHNPRQASLFD